MRSMLLGATALIMSTSFAFAGDDIMTNYFGNTLISTSSLAEIHTHYKADKTFDGKATSLMGNMDFKGTWTFDDKGNLCRTYENAMPGVPNPLCTPWEAHKVGDKWTMTFNGQSRDLSLVAGVQ
jgi:hypothetical protein